MATISVTLPSDGESIEAADVNTPINTIVNAINGNLDSDNIKDASITPQKLTNFGSLSWSGVGYTPNTVTYNGNRSYDLVFNSNDLTSYISAGMRLRTTRTAAAPNQCTSLNGTTQYFSKTSPAGMTFTNNFVVSAWIKLNNYPASAGAIVSRFDGTNGYQMTVNSSGQLTVTAFKGGAGNGFNVISYQSVPLNKWVHVAVQTDMTSTTNSATVNYVMIDGVDVPAQCTRAGTNPTDFTQAGSLLVGATNSTTPASFFPGKIAQAAIFNAKVTQSTIRGYYSQGLVGTETSLISAYSLSNSVNDLNTTNANNLTANGSATTTNADSPFGGQADGTISTTLDYAIIQKASFSTNTTLTVQVPEGCTIPTTGGVSAVSYSIQKAPYQMPVQEDKWTIQYLQYVGLSFGGTHNTWNAGTTTATTITMPVGSWTGGYQVNRYLDRGAATWLKAYTSLSTSTSANTDNFWLSVSGGGISNGGCYVWSPQAKTGNITLSTATAYYIIGKGESSDGVINNNTIDNGSLISFKNAYL